MGNRWIVRVDNGPGTRATVTKHDSLDAAYADVDAALEQRNSNSSTIEDIKLYVVVDGSGKGPELIDTFGGWY